MLNSIRNSLKYTKWVLLLVIASFVLFFGTSWWEGCGRTGGGDWVASVNGQVVRQAEWRQIARFLDAQYRQRLGDNYDLIRGEGFDLTDEVISLCLEAGALVAKGSWYWVGKEGVHGKFQGKGKLRAWLEDPEEGENRMQVLRRVANAYLERVSEEDLFAVVASLGSSV